MVVVSGFVALYYNILMTYIIFFFFASLGPTLPWAGCDNSWNTKRCLTADEFTNATILNSTLEGKSIVSYSIINEYNLQTIKLIFTKLQLNSYYFNLVYINIYLFTAENITRSELRTPTEEYY